MVSDTVGGPTLHAVRRAVTKVELAARARRSTADPTFRLANTNLRVAASRSDAAAAHVLLQPSKKPAPCSIGIGDRLKRKLVRMSTILLFISSVGWCWPVLGELRSLISVSPAVASIHPHGSYCQRLNRCRGKADSEIGKSDPFNSAIVASGSEKQLESHRREITALFCDLRGFTGFTESADAEDVMALLRDYHAAIGEIIIKYNGTLERYAGDGVMVVFNDPVPVENPALQAVLMALEVRDAIGALTETWRRLGHDIGFGIGIAHGFATLGTIGFEGRFDYAAIGTVSNVASRLCDEAKPGQILISPRVLTKVENAVKVEPVGEFELKGIRRPLAAYNVIAAV